MRKLRFLVAAVLVLSMLIGIGTLGAAQAQSVTLQLMMAADWNNDGMRAMLEKAKEITGYDVEVTVYPGGDYNNVVKTKLVTGDVPDLFFTNIGLTQYPSDKLEPLTGDWINTVNETTMTLMVRADGAVVQAPFVPCDQYGIVYNKTVFEQAGVTLPLKNYNELLAACESIQAIGITPITIPNQEVWTAQIFMLASLVNVFEKDGVLDMTQPDAILANELKPQDIPAFVERWERLQQLVDLGFVNSDYMSTSLQMSQQAVAEGTAGMMAGLSAFYGPIQTDYPEYVADTGMSLVNFGDSEPYACIGAANSFIAVPAEAQYKAEALEFLNVMISQDVLALYFDYIPGLPPYQGMEVAMSPWNEEMSALAEVYPTYDAFTTQLWAGEFWGDFNLHVQNLVAGKDPVECITAWYNAYATEMQAKRAPGFE